MKTIKDLITKKLEAIEQVLQKARLSLAKAPDGNLRIARKQDSRGIVHPQYYVVTQKGDTKGTYLPQSKIDTAKKIAQRDYDQKVVEVASQLKKILGDFLSTLPSQSVSHLYTDNPERRQLITPYILTDEEYTQQWLTQPYNPKPFNFDAPEIYTEKGERVRSKSEKIIADKLYSMGIPYRYEAPVKIKKHREILTFYPDFTILDVSNRREIILEHFGMMSNPEYAQKTVGKLNLYGKNGWFPGKNMMITMETENTPLDTKVLVKTLEEMLQ